MGKHPEDEKFVLVFKKKPKRTENGFIDPSDFAVPNQTNVVILNFYIDQVILWRIKLSVSLFVEIKIQTNMANSRNYKKVGEWKSWNDMIPELDAGDLLEIQRGKIQVLGATIQD